MESKGKSFFKSAFLVTTMMLCFKVLGFVKQAFIAYYYGASIETDMYFIAWGFITGVSEAIVKALSVSLVATYTSIRVRKGRNEASKLINGMLELMLPIFVALILLTVLGAPVFAKVLAPTYSNDNSNRLSNYLQLLAPTMLFVYLELIFGAVLDSNKSFFIPRLQSLIYSILTMLSCVILSQALGVNALILSQYLASVLFTLIIIRAVKKYHSFFLIHFKDIPQIKEIIYTAFPLFIGNSAIQINQIVDKTITSGLGAGATSALSYCHNLEQFVTNIMIVNIGNIMFANFAEYVANEDYDEIKKTLSKSINILIGILAGISIITITHSTDIVTIVYYRGNFTKDAVTLTSVALIGYAISFVAVAVRDLSIKSLYAFKDTKSPMIASIIAICINILFSIILSRYFGVFGVSLATSISAVVGMIINACFFRKHLTEYEYKKHFLTFLKCIPAMLVLAALCYGVQRCISGGSLLRFLASTVIGLPLYLFVLFVFKVDGIREGFEIIMKRIRTVQLNK